MEAKYSMDNICALSGFNFIDKLLKDKGIFDTNDNSMNNSGLLARFGYGGLIRSLLSGGTCTKDIT